MKDPLRHIYIVDDDPAVLKALARLLRAVGYEPITFTSAQAFMDRYQPEVPGCLILDISLPGITGLELQQWLVRANSLMPIIFITGRADIPTSVQAMRHGAVDFLTKPINDTDLLNALQEAARRESKARAAQSETQAIEAKLAELTPRELEILYHVVAGRLNKQIASELGIVEKTIKVHRARVMKKMQVKSLAELVRLSQRAGIGPSLLPPASSPAPHRSPD